MKYEKSQWKFTYSEKGICFWSFNLADINFKITQGLITIDMDGNRFVIGAISENKKDKVVQLISFDAIKEREIRRENAQEYFSSWFEETQKRREVFEDFLKSVLSGGNRMDTYNNYKEYFKGEKKDFKSYYWGMFLTYRSSLLIHFKVWLEPVKIRVIWTNQ